MEISEKLDVHDRAIISKVTEHPGLSVADLARQAGIPVSTARYRVMTLAKAGIISTIRERKIIKVFPANSGQ